MKRGWIVIVLVFLMSIFLMGTTTAIDACCQQTISGDSCVFTDETQCDSAYLSTPTACEQTSFCQVGTCFSSDDGTCFENTPKATCEAEEGTSWSPLPKDELPQCQEGCCTIADQAFYVTEVKCKAVGTEFGDAPVSFDPTIETESACLASVRNQEYGCCVTGDSSEFVTRAECGVEDVTSPGTDLEVEGFHEGVLCSNDLLTTGCAKQHSTQCYDGKIYWYDSCGNRENIWSSDARESYNNGYILDEIDSCTINGANDPTCGNCDYTIGTTCGPDTLNAIEDNDLSCVDLNCPDTAEHEASPLAGGSRLNGESWCVYDSRPGQGGDLVGSRHYRSLCINGEEIVEPCADFREEFCISGVLGEESFGNLEALNLDQDNVYVEAACRPNRANSCSECNDPEGGAVENFACCTNEDLRDCSWLSDGGGAGVCVPQVPPGTQFWSEDGSGNDASSATVCSAASTECTATYRIGGVRALTGGRKNPDAWTLVSESPDGCVSDQNWLVDQNTLCRSLGDCGAYYNFAGEAGFDGFTTTMYDEEFFFEKDRLREADLGDIDFLQSADITDESNQFHAFKSAKLYQNPAFWAAAGSFIVGGVAGVQQCNAADNLESLKEVSKEEEKKIKEIDETIQFVSPGEEAFQEPVESEVLTEEEEELVQARAEEEAILSRRLECDNQRAVNNEACEQIAASGEEGSQAQAQECNLAVAATHQECIDKISNDFPRQAPAVLFGAPGDALGQAGQLLGFGQQAQSFTKELGGDVGCFASSAIPLIGLAKTFEKGPEEDELAQIQRVIEGTKYANQLAKNLKKMQNAPKTVRVANIATTILAAYLIVEYSQADTQEITYNVECNLWQAPEGGNNCELCNNDDTPCSEYKCRSLGAACDLVNEGTSEEACVSLNINDANSPIIESAPALLGEGFTISETVEEGNKGYIINERVPAFTPVTLSILTDEPAQCKYSALPETEFQDKNNFFGSELYLYNHSLLFSLSAEAVTEQAISLTGGEHTVYIRCSDANGNHNERDYFIRFEVDDTPDLTPPEVVFTSVESGSFMPVGVEELDFSIFTNEPAQCRWSTEDLAYEFMTGSMVCPTSGFAQSSVFFGTYECSTTLTGVSQNELNDYYFRCEDNSGNINEDSVKFFTRQTKDPLVITELLPTGRFFGLDITLAAQTVDGAENGRAECRFSNTDVGYNAMIPFLNTNTTQHTQTLSLAEGDYTYYIGCQDRAGNRVFNQTTLSVEIDTSGPRIDTLYVDTAFSTLFLEMDEKSTCEYAKETFTYGEGSLMTGTNTTIHEASLDALQYNIICADSFGNRGTYLVDISTWKQ